MVSWAVLGEINGPFIFAFFPCKPVPSSGSGHCHWFPESSALQQRGVIAGVQFHNF